MKTTEIYCNYVHGIYTWKRIPFLSIQGLLSILVWVSFRTYSTLPLLIRTRDFMAEAVQLELPAMLAMKCLVVVLLVTSNDHIVNLEHHPAQLRG